MRLALRGHLSALHVVGMGTLGNRSKVSSSRGSHQADSLRVGVCIRIARLEPLSISKRVQTMVGRRTTRVDTGNHDDLRLVRIQERVTQHHGQL